jgi:hypothetical protein
MTVDIPMDRITSQTLLMSTPFATFQETGTQRDGAKIWYDYKYHWMAMKVTGVR